MTQLNSTSTVRALLLPLLLGTLTAHAAASDLHVDDDQQQYPTAKYTSIQAAVDAACHYDTIYVHAGTYTGTGSEVVLINETIDLVADTTYGDVVIDGELWRRGLTLLGTDSDSNMTIDEIRVSGFKIINGFARSGQGPNSEHGGGIYAEGNVSIEDCEISNCHSDGNGGGVAVFNPDMNSTGGYYSTPRPYTYVRLERGSVEHCQAASDGGGIWNWESYVTLAGPSIKLNQADGRGGGIAAHHWYCQEGKTLLSRGGGSGDHTEVWGNTSLGDGGGVFAEGNQGETSFTNVEIVNNRTLAGDGGGVSLFNANAVCSILTVAQNYAEQTFAGGSGGYGGGLAARNSSLKMASYSSGSASILFLENTASAGGGGLFAKDSEIKLSEAGFEENLTLGKGGGIAAISCTEFELDEVTFLGNVGRVAGGLYLKNTYGTLTDSSVLHNKGFMNGGMNGAGITIDGSSAELVISGTNFWQNTKKHIMKGNGGKFTDGGGNDVQP